MLYARIQNPAQIHKQDGPYLFDIVSSDIMLVSVGNYTINFDSLVFRIDFGRFQSPESSEGPAPSLFVSDFSMEMTLTSEDLSTWGIDDTEVLHIVAEKIGTSVLEVIEIK